MGRIVTTRQGRVEGAEQSGVHVFRGIPFARPPLGDLRFCAPEPPQEWSGTRPATTNGPAAPQIGPVNRLIRMLIGVAGSRQSQDCLYLNVWTPAAGRKRRPVMVFIHGGAFILGSGTTPLYSGWRLATRGDVVVVTINYRLGALGFLSWTGLSDDADRPPANLGLRDQIAALEWVRDNIDSFGGDPENVTVFGESAGAMSTATLLGTPSAQGLFHRAILQSGAGHNVSSAEQGERAARIFVESLGITGGYAKALRECSVTDLMAAQARTTARIGLDDGMMAWQPCVDGDLVPEQPLTQIERGMAANIPLLIGTNRDEWKLFMAADPSALRMSDQELTERLRRAFPGQNEDGESYAELAGKAYYRVKGRRGAVPFERWAALQSDRLFHYPAMRLADLQSAHQAQTYAYVFEWNLPLLGGVLGACHGLELPFVFGGLRRALPQLGPLNLRGARRLCDRIQDCWIAFARSGSPEHTGLADWPEYSEECRNAMKLGDQCSLRVDPHQRGREFWDPISREGGWKWW